MTRAWSFRPPLRMGSQYGMYGKPSWIGVLIFGIVTIAAGVIALSMSVSTSNNDPLDPFNQIDNQAARNFGIFGAVFLVVGIVLIVVSFVVKAREENKEVMEAQAVEEAHRRDVEEIAQAVKSTIKIRCRYCGTLNDETSVKCESCGASL